ncbi:AraC-type DNA-binding protein [Prauserella halophila]|nr:AraC-type DNA-binding protein [Prauserella halophila]
MGDGWAAARPQPRLRPWVARYVGYRSAGAAAAAAGPQSVHRGLPSGHLTLNISLGEPVRIVGMPRGDQAPGEFRALLGGLHTAPVLIARGGTEFGLEVALEPAGAAAVLGVPAAELTGHVVDLTEFGRDLARLPERLAEAPDWAHRFAILDDVLSARTAGDSDAVDAAGAAASDVEWAWRLIRRSGGTVRVADLARETGWSRRRFGERFRREIGLTPKQAARVVRFERAAGLLKAGRGLAETAALCGFSDQPHLTGEWRALAGCVPTTWLAEERPFLQDPLPVPDPDSEP